MRSNILYQRLSAVKVILRTVGCCISELPTVSLSDAYNGWEVPEYTTVDIVVASGGGRSILASLAASTARPGSGRQYPTAAPYSNTATPFPRYYRIHSFSIAALNGYNYLLTPCSTVLLSCRTVVQKHECCEAICVELNT